MPRGLPMALLLAGLFGCTPPPASPSPPDASVDGSPADGALGAADLCAHAEEGCPCDVTRPRECYPAHDVLDDGSFLCRVGTQTCRDGRWSACEGVSDFVVQPTGTELLNGPDICTPCNPRCFAHSDRPTTVDLTPSNSSDAEYDPLAGGIRPRATGSGPAPLPDTDGDGVPDVADECVGAGAYRAADGSCYGGLFFFHTLPMGGPPAIDVAPIRIQIRTADVYFLMDTTGSMGGELARLRTDLTSGSFLTGCTGGIIGAIRCQIPDAWFGVGYHDDYPYGSYGSSGDHVYRNTQDITASVSAAQAAVSALSLHYGNDGPESQIPALWSVATGGGLGSYSPARTGCPAGTFGYPCFRNGTIPIVIHITDAPYHNGPSGAYPYSIPGHVPPTFAATTSALSARGVRVITVQTCGSWSNSYCIEGENHAKALGNASGSLGSSGLPYVLRANADGSGLSATIVNAVRDLANYASMDITARASGDTQGFTRSITAVSWGPGVCAGISGGTTFLDCLPGANVRFDVAFQNTTVPSTSSPQVFSFFIEVVGNGTAVLERIPVRIVVPPSSSGYLPEATYWHDYDTTTTCLIDEQPFWGTLLWSTEIPAGTSMRIDLRGARSLAALPTATPVASIDVTSSGPGSADISALLIAAGAPEGLPFLRAFVTMRSSADLSRAPVLHRLELSYTCVPAA